MADLYSRLKRIKAGRGAGGDGRQTDAAGEDGPRGSAGAPRERRTPGVEVVPLTLGPDWHEAAPMVFARETVETIAAPPALTSDGRHLESRLLGRRVDLESLRFMDTETTGLSGGAGTTAFLVGSGVLDGHSLRVRQILLVDFPGEPGFLEETARSLASDVWVSYNGKAFDARLLESRFLMNGMPPLAAEQLDLLFWSRRLWRSTLGSCSLGNIEREILGRGRNDDIPGMEIPERYFQFLRDGNGAGLEDVFEHHRLDIVSLAHLFFRVERILGDPLAAADADPALDCYQLGRWMLATDEAIGLELLERAVSDERREAAVRAALVLSRRYRRSGRSDDALRVLSRVAALSRAEERLATVVVEMAKIFEHDHRDPERARALVAECLGPDGNRGGAPGLGSGMQASLRYRLERLERKVASRAAAEGQSLRDDTARL